MEWLETSLIPEECKDCTEEDCYNCDTAGKRWTISVEAELRSNRMIMVRAIERLKRKVAAIDAELEALRNK